MIGIVYVRPGRVAFLERHRTWIRKSKDKISRMSVGEQRKGRKGRRANEKVEDGGLRERLRRRRKNELELF